MRRPSPSLKSGTGQRTGIPEDVPQHLRAAFLELPARHQRFIAEYLACLNATEAARRAGYSHKTANEQGSQLLVKLSVYISPQVAADLQNRLMEANEIVQKLQQIATTDIADFLTWDGKAQILTLKNPNEIPPELRQCIESITQYETKHAKYLTLKLHSKVAALGMLAKYHNLFKRTVASKGLVVVIQRPANAPQEPHKAPIVVNPKNGHGKPVLPEITFSRPPGAKSASTTGAGATNGNGSDAEPGGKS